MLNVRSELCVKTDLKQKKETQDAPPFLTL